MLLYAHSFRATMNPSWRGLPSCGIVVAEQGLDKTELG